MKRKYTAAWIVQHFLQGVLILAPIAFTGYAIYWIFEKLDGLIRLNIPHVGIIPGLGLLAIFATITLVGYLSSSFILGRLFSLFDQLLEKTPVIKYIYSSVKDFFDAFFGEKRKFNKPVLVHIYSDEVWEVGFITQEDMTHFGLKDMVAVYVPMSYAISGKVFVVNKVKVRTMENISAGEAMKFAVAGGIMELEGDGTQPLAGFS
ncbi:MAG: DUF502 domain-containing protein [Chitinophagaceae bacterium]